MSVQFCSEATQEANVETAKEWKHLILLETERVVQKEFCCADEITREQFNCTGCPFSSGTIVFCIVHYAHQCLFVLYL